MLYVLSTVAAIFLPASIIFLLFQKKHVAEKEQLAVEQKLSQVRGEMQHLALRVEISRQAIDKLESRIAERNQEIRLLKENLVAQERQERLANAVGW